MLYPLSYARTCLLYNYLHIAAAPPVLLRRKPPSALHDIRSGHSSKHHEPESGLIRVTQLEKLTLLSSNHICSWLFCPCERRTTSNQPGWTDRRHCLGATLALLSPVELRGGVVRVSVKSLGRQAAPYPALLVADSMSPWIKAGETRKMDLSGTADPVTRSHI